MSGHLCWGDARAAAERLRRRPTARQLLGLLEPLALASSRTLARLLGLADAARVYVCLADLQAAGLVGFVRPSFRPHGSPRLPYPTDLGLAVAALLEDVDVAELVRRGRLTRAGLLGRVPGLAPLRAVRSLLAAVAASRPGRPRLRRWEQPWRARFRPPTAKHPVSLALPAYAELAWEDGAAAACFLVPDEGRLRIDAYRPVVDRLIALRHALGGALPALVVATPDRRRADAWWALLDDRARERRESPLGAVVARWRDVDAGLAEAAGRPELWAGALPAPPARPAGRPAPADGRRLPVLVGGPLDEARPSEPRLERLGHLALALTAADLAILEKLGPHPFLSTAELALWLGRRRCEARFARKSLIARGLVRLLTEEELAALRRPDGAARLLTPEQAAAHAAEELTELTVDGLELLAAHWGLSLEKAVAFHGLCGGGPRAPIGPRAHLLRFFEHTRATDAFFLAVIGLVQGRERRRGDGLLTWQNATACRRGGMRPDGYAAVRWRGKPYRFFHECDRATMKPRDLRQKLHAYQERFDAELTRAQAGRLAEHPTFPTILVVTADDRSEERIARAAVEVAEVYRHRPPLPLLLTSRWRIDDPANPHGPLGPLWRDPAGADRRRAPSPDTSEARP